MAGNPVASINAQLGLDSTQFNTELGKAPGKARAAAKEIQSAFSGDNLFGDGFGKAISKVFDSSKVKILDEGAAQIRVFGSALEPLGPAGIAAGAGIAAVAAAMEEAKKAAEYADQLEDVAKKLGITTTQLQEYDFIALKAGISTETFRGALQTGQQAFGAFISNVGDAKVKDAFKTLGISKDQARSYGDLASILPLIATRLKGLGNEAEEAQIAKKLGLGEMLAALKDGGSAMEAAARQAHELGLVLDEDLIKKGAEANKQMQIAAHTIDVELKSAFIELAPAIASIVTWLSKAVATLVHFLDLRHQLGDRQTQTIQWQLQEQQKGPDIPGAVAKFFGGKVGPDGRMKGSAAGPLQDMFNRRAANQEDERDELDERGWADQEDAAEAARKARAGAIARVPEKAGAKPRDITTEEDNKTQNELATARKDLTAAVKADADALRSHTETATIEGKLQEQLTDAQNVNEATNAEITADLNEKLTKLDEEAAKIKAANNGKVLDSNAAAQLARIAETKTILETAAVRKRITAEDELMWADEKAAREALVSRINKAFDLLDQVAQLKLGMDQIKAGYANSTDTKRASDLNLLADQKGLDDSALKRKYELLIANTPKGDGYASQVASLQAEYGLAQNFADKLYQLRQQKTLFDDVSPLQKWAREATMDAGKVHDALENEAVKALDGFNDGIADAIANGKSLGDVMHDVFASMEADLIKYLLKQAELNLFGGIAPATPGGTASPGLLSGALGGLGHLFGFATGGSFTVGGSGGIDSNLVSMRLTKGEMVDIRRPDQMRDTSGFTYAPTIDARGADQAAVTRLAQLMAAQQRALPDIVRGVVNKGLGSGKIAAPSFAG